MGVTSEIVENRVLIVAPTGADALNISSILEEAGVATKIYADVVGVAEGVREGCGVLLMTEEAMNSMQHALLVAELHSQPAWSDLPLILITSGGKLNVLGTQAVRLIGQHVNLAIIERPLRRSTLVAAIGTALRARRRQYECRDLLDERQKLLTSLESRVAERTTELRQMVEELDAFSYSVSHDLRVPLRILAGYAQALTEDYGDSLAPGAKELLNRISRTAARMDRLTQDVLAYTRISRSDLTLETVDLDVIIPAVIEQYPTILGFKDSIRIRAPLGLVVGHVPSLTQCFSNLLENALKFVREGEAPEVEIGSERRGGWIRVAVQDHGVGVDPAHHERIFGIFERASRDPFPGTGIGLAIVKKAVERMGGATGVVSAVDQGASFWIELRSAEGQARPPVSLQAPSRPSMPKTNFGR